jgi:murein DD-endopeptidase MepM/ murein hydrolase activator NlpD
LQTDHSTMTRSSTLMTCWAAGLIALGGSQAQSQVVQSLDLLAPFAPVVADSGGTRQLAYELHLTNFSLQPVVLDRITVIDQDSRQIIGKFEGAQIDSSLARAGRRGKEGIRNVDPGARTLVYFNLPLIGEVPRSVAHQIDFHFAAGEDVSSKQVSGAVALVNARAPVRLGPPLRGGPWAAVFAPEMERGHRRVVYATGGEARIPGRFAVDWIKLDDKGLPAPKGATRLDAYFGHGSEVLAVADATVAGVRDDVPEAETLATIPKVSIGDASGNYISLDLGGGRFAFYEHLQRGIPVRPGQRVKRGDVIGRLGLTGQGSSPHLHFHVANANSLLEAEGLPFVIEGMRVLGNYPSIEAIGRGGPWVPTSGASPAGPYAPAPNSVVSFKTIR